MKVKIDQYHIFDKKQEYNVLVSRISLMHGLTMISQKKINTKLTVIKSFIPH